MDHSWTADRFTCFRAVCLYDQSELVYRLLETCLMAYKSRRTARRGETSITHLTDCSAERRECVGTLCSFLIGHRLYPCLRGDCWVIGLAELFRGQFDVFGMFFRVIMSCSLYCFVMSTVRLGLICIITIKY